MMNFLDVLFFMMVLVESKNVDCRSFTSILIIMSFLKLIVSSEI
jgi:hypothetical protein